MATQKIGWRPYVSPLSSLLTSIYGVWNGDTSTTTLATGAYGAWNAEGTVTASQLMTSASSAWNAEALGTTLDTSIYNYWSGENVTTDLVNGNNGTLMSGATFSAGKIGNAFSFNGSNSYLKLGNNSINFTGDFSISCWVNVSGIGSWSQYIYAFGNLQNSGSNYYGYSLFIYGNAYAFDICNGTTTISGYQSASAQGLFYNSAGDISAQIAPVNGGAWKHVVITRKAGTGTKMYINGVLKTSNTSTVNPVYTTTHTPSIGGQIMNSGNSFGGAASGVDLVSTWSKELSADEVLSLYNFGNATEYPYSTKTLPSAKDAIGTKNGALMNGCTYTTGKIGSSAFTFDGVNDYVALPDNSLNSLVGDFTVSGWVYAPANTSSSYCVLLSNVSNDFTTGKGWSVFTYGNNIYFDVYYSGAYQSPNSAYVRLQVNSKLTNNAWNHIVVTRKNSTGSKIYVNGSLVGSDTSTLNPATPTLTVTPTIGVLSSVSSGNALSSYAPNGTKIDAVSTWSRELNSDEISALYNGGTGQQYPFSTITVGTPSDSVSTNNGTIVGGVTYTTGIVGNAFQFDGSTGYVSLPANSLNFTGDFSASLWVNFSSLSSCTLIESTGFGNNTSAQEGTSGWNLIYSTGYLYFNNYNDNNLVQLGTNSLNTTNTWYHIVVKSSSSGMGIYLNGTLITSNTTTQYANYRKTVSPRLGLSRSGTGYFPGKMDAVTLWSKKLTDDEITQLYNMGGGIQYPFTTQTIKTPYAVYNGDSLVDPIGAKNATINGSVTYTTGKIGNAYTFDGTTGYLTLPANSMRFAGSLSISMWVYPTVYPTTAQVQIGLISNTSFGYKEGFDISLYNPTGNVSTYIRFGNGTTVNSGYVMEMTPSALPLNTWTLLTVTFEAGVGLKAYYNGVLQASVSSSATTLTYADMPATYTPTIGYGSNATGPNYGVKFAGQIDGLTFWNSALTYPEVSALYNAGSGMEYPYPSSIPALLPSASDSYGTNNGTLMNGCTFTTGKIGKAFIFDGVNDYVALPNNCLNFATLITSGNNVTGGTGLPYSISAWVYLTDITTYQSIIGNFDSSGAGYKYGWQLYAYQGAIYFQEGYNTTSANINSGSITANTWYNVTIVRNYNGTTPVNMQMYINGTLVTTLSSTNAMRYSTLPVMPCIGADKFASNPAQDYVKNGTRIDGVAAWSKSLNSTEVASLYNAGAGKQYPSY